MASLTPKHRSGEVVDSVMKEGLVNGVMVLVPSLGGLAVALRNPKFRKLTNWQSRTALVIMPALFAFGLTSEQKLVHRMHEVAAEEEHAMQTVDWAEQVYKASPEDVKLHDLYKQAILQQGHVRLIDGDSLTTYHQVANYVQANPFKVILGIGIPSIFAIFGKEMMNTSQMQLKILHTRVFGQAAVISSLLGVMGIKATMDQQGRYITPDELESRVQEMQKARTRMLQRIEQVNQEHHFHKPEEK
mmetsp:Transcript_55028/g.159317  ORF Transcript_55028/g.159317 Transcript_55028/m.159317 type:complete len:245 (-) Transcript_55028:114-848(-)|eukprot:CAMPEP_0176025586 /NCGR_PEP_ID=MMETSP0120_2-20121206/12519_1 /TAXON_ID=160619 /ORGANISM="Kryptoperidinium foliaceum, Strain CCMP 1326" /LENGTH=244 /DNA_ID=CAMNT_0017358771 /DNA_START=117 /DNA_END=851 /DNA_ORIENTATION=+